MARTGYIYFDESSKRWTARVTFTDSNGKKRNIRRGILSRDEEERLLVVCGDPVRAHLRLLIIAALDTGCRKGELLSLNGSKRR